MPHTRHDRNVLRELAKRVVEIAALPVQAERIEQWKHHNSLQSTRPMILIFPEGSWGELLPESILECEQDHARRTERSMRRAIYAHEHFADDAVCTAEFVVPKAIHDSGWGLGRKRIDSTVARGAWKFDPVITSRADLKKIRCPQITHDADETQRRLAEAQELIGDILPVRAAGVAHVSFHLMNQYTGWRGLEQVMMDMIENPGWVHEAMSLLSQCHARRIEQLEACGGLDLNNNNAYQGTGGNGWIDELPASDFDGRHVRPVDMWASAETQEFAQVSPQMHEEFALQYERPLLERFGLTAYGCCEDLSRKLGMVKAIPNMRRISISPFADVDACASQLGGAYIFSWKPHPADLAKEFDADRIRAYLRHTLEVARDHGCVLEIVLKDTHTCENKPERFDRWSRIARELCDEFAATME